MDTFEQEARIFTKYLVNRNASPQAIQLYKAAVSTSKPDTTDKKLLNFMLVHPHSIGLIDAGLVFHNPNSEARRRLYLMLSILEASVECSDLFLPKKRGSFYMVVIFFAGVRAIIKAFLGLLLVKAVA